MKKIVPIITIFTLIKDAFAQPSKADRFIDSFAGKNNFNGTILIEQHSKTVYRKSFGFANFAFKEPNTTDTKYKVASITKAFTSVLILQLYEQRKIDLESSIATSDEMIANYCSDTLVSNPGTRFDYNNADYVILGKIIERITGKTYEEALKEKILKPLNMSNSGMISQEKIIDKLADTYFYRDTLKILTNDLPVYKQLVCGRCYVFYRR